MPDLGQSAKISGGSRCEQIPGAERRRARRAALRWTVRLISDEFESPVRATTRNVSSDGFYCVLPNALTPGERIHCDIVVPTHSMVDTDDVAYLRCRAVVVRVEPGEKMDEFGVACRIEEYSVVHVNRNGRD